MIDFVRTTNLENCYRIFELYMRMPALVQINERFIDFAMFLSKRYFLSGGIVGHLKMAAFAFELFEMIGDVFCSDEFVPEYRTHKPSGKRKSFVSY